MQQSREEWRDAYDPLTEEEAEEKTWIEETSIRGKSFTAYFTMLVKDEPHHMNLETGLPQLISLIISRSMFGPTSEDYAYLDKLIEDAVESFTVKPSSQSFPETRMAPTDMAGDLARITAAYERLLTLGIEVKEMKVLAAKLVWKARKTPGAGNCLMHWVFQQPQES
ncbi:MAG: hypothetical protein Q9199_001502 [Rusavskia elegans]